MADVQPDSPERDQAVDAFVLVLAATCDGLDLAVLLEGVSRFLAMVVSRGTKTEAGIGEFAKLFEDTLRDEWRRVVLERAELAEQVVLASRVN